MRHFYKLIEGVPFLAPMNELMQYQMGFIGGETIGVDHMPVYPRNGHAAPSLEGVALSLLQMTSGTQLVSAWVARLEHKAMLELPTPEDASCYAAVLRGADKAFAMSGGESLPLRTGEIWWIDLKSDNPVLINNGDDDVLVLLAHIHLGLIANA